MSLRNRRTTGLGPRAVSALAAMSLALSGCSALGLGDDGPLPTVLVVDSSGSMAGDDAPGPRIDAARSAARALVDAMPDDGEVGLVAYGANTTEDPAQQAESCRDIEVLHELGPVDRGALSDRLDELEPGGFTAISGALREAVGILPTDEEAAIVLLSDGEDTCGDPPPCEVAREISQSHPDVTVSTVGFKTADEELACIARTTGGLYLTADNVDQLISRLVAAQNVSENREALTPTGLTGIELGQHYNEIIATYADYPAQDSARSEGELVVLEWRDCDWVFTEDGMLEEIRPHDGGNVDGVGVGSRLADLSALYGMPHRLEEGAGSEGLWLYPASLEAGTGWKVRTEESGEVTAMGLCLCLPAEQEAEAQGVHVTLAPYEEGGGLKPEYEDLIVPEREPGNHRWACSPSDEPSLYRCGWYATDYLGPSDCSVDSRAMRAWCPGLTDEGEVFFEELPLAMVTDFGSDPRPDTGLRPAVILFDDGTVCRPGSVLGGMRQGAGEVAYSCGNDYVYGSVSGSESAGYSASVGPDNPRVSLRTSGVKRMLTIEP